MERTETEEQRTLRYAQNLSKMIQVETISVNNVAQVEKFRPFHQTLRDCFPHLFAACQAEDFEGSLLLRWPGEDGEKMPILLMSHFDVVEATGEWTHGPFSGDIADGFVWGRGTLDTKGTLWAMLQAADDLAREGFRPPVDVYFESACNEETDGAGADRITRELQARGLRFSLVLDEGSMVVRDPIGGSQQVYAMVGVGERGCADLKFVARSRGGHASTPGKDTPLVRLGRFMVQAEESKLFDTALPPVIQEMLRRMAPSMHGTMKLAARHPALFVPLLKRMLDRMSPETAAMLRTTLAFTMSQGSQGCNVLPQEAWVVGNMRYSHHQGKKESFRAVEELARRFGLETQVLDGGLESPVSPWDSDAFRLVEAAVGEAFPEARPVPCIITCATDCRFFHRVSDNCLRFSPLRVDPQQQAGIHGVDEAISLSALVPAVDFYRYVIQKSGTI